MKRLVSGIMLTLLLASLLTLAFNVQPVKASGTIYIRADGSVDPPDAPISTVDNMTYFLTGNITSDVDGIVVERSNIIVNGNGYTLQGSGSGDGFSWNNIDNVTIKNAKINGFCQGIYMWNSANYNIISGNEITNSEYGIKLTNNEPYYSNYNSIIGNTLTDNWCGIEIRDYCTYNSIIGNNIIGSNVTANRFCGIAIAWSSNNNSVYGNNITNNDYGTRLYSSLGNMIYHNNFIDNSQKAWDDGYSVTVWDDGYPSGGNYWSDYADVDLNSDGIWDHPYVIDANNQDHYPLVSPWTLTLAVRIVGYAIALNSDNTVNAVLNVTMLSPYVSSKEVTCWLALVDPTGREVYDNFLGIGGPVDEKRQIVCNDTKASIEFTFQLSELHSGEYAYSVSVWNPDSMEIYDSTDWVSAFECHSVPVYTENLGILNPFSSFYAEPPEHVLTRLQRVAYTFKLAENVTDLTVTIRSLTVSQLPWFIVSPDFRFSCTLSSETANKQMDLSWEGIFNKYWPSWTLHNVLNGTYELTLEVASVIVWLSSITIESGAGIDETSVIITKCENVSAFATPGGTMDYRVQTEYTITRSDLLSVTATIGDQACGNQTFPVEVLDVNTHTFYMRVNAPLGIGTYEVIFNATLNGTGDYQIGSGTLDVRYSTYNITLAPSVRYYQIPQVWQSWSGEQNLRDVSDYELHALEVTDIKIAAVDEYDEQTQKPLKVSISFNARNKDADLHQMVYIQVGSNVYPLAALISNDPPKLVAAHNIPVVDEKVSFTILYQYWLFGYCVELGSTLLNAAVSHFLGTVDPLFVLSAGASEAAVNFAKYLMLYIAQEWIEVDNAYMTMEDAANLIEDRGVDRSAFDSILTNALSVTQNPYYAYSSVLDYLHDSRVISDLNYLMARVEAVEHAIGKAASRWPVILNDAVENAAAKMGVTLEFGAATLLLSYVPDLVKMFRGLGNCQSIIKIISVVRGLACSLAEEGKIVTNAEVGIEPAVKIDPVFSMAFRGSTSTTNMSYFGDMQDMSVNISQAQARMTLNVDANLTSQYLMLFSDEANRANAFSGFGFNATETHLIWEFENHTFIIDGEGATHPGLISLQLHVNSTQIEGIQVMSVDALQEDNIAWLNGTLSYPFGRQLNYCISVFLPQGSQILNALPSANCTIEGSTLTWNCTVDTIAIEFIPPVHDITLEEVIMARTVVGQGFSTKMNLTLQNRGDYTENFNVTFYANASAIGTMTGITLGNGSSTTITFTWNTTGWAKGNYTISAYAWPVQGETDTEDNNSTDGWVTVTIPGDVDGDRDVDIYDVVKITSRYGEILPPIWPFPPIDLDDDGVITIYDVVICTSHYGQKWP